MNENENGAVVVPRPKPAKPSKKATGSQKRGKVKKSASAPAGTLGELSERYIEHLETAGKSAGTIFSYGIELRTACKELGADTQIAKLTPDQVRAYFNSAKVTKLRTGKPKAKPSIDKTRRVLRLALVWAEGQKWIERAPLPEIK